MENKSNYSRIPNDGFSRQQNIQDSNFNPKLSCNTNEISDLRYTRQQISTNYNNNQHIQTLNQRVSFSNNETNQNIPNKLPGNVNYMTEKGKQPFPYDKPVNKNVRFNQQIPFEPNSTSMNNQNRILKDSKSTMIGTNEAPSEPKHANQPTSNKENGSLETIMKNYFQKFQAIPTYMNEQFSNVKKPHPWKIALEENRKFGHQLVNTDIPKNQYLHQDIEPNLQQFEVPSNPFHEYQFRWNEETKKCQTELVNTFDTLNFYQKLLEIVLDAEKMNINEQKDVSKAFSGLSNHMWEYLQKNFQLDGSQISQDYPLVADVSERISSQKAWEDAKAQNNLESAKEKFLELIKDPKKAVKIEGLRDNEKILLQSGILDDSMMKDLFGYNHTKLGNSKPTVNKQSTHKSELIKDFEVISQQIQQTIAGQSEKNHFQVQGSQKNFESGFPNESSYPKAFETQQSGFLKDYIMDIEGGEIQIFAENDCTEFNTFNFMPEEEFSLNPER